MYMFMIWMCACICVLCTCLCARHTRAQIFKYSHAHIPPRTDLLGPSKVMIKGGRDFLMPSFPFGQSSDYARQAWNFYCDCHGSGVRDPRRPGLSLESVLRWRCLNMSCWVATWDPYKLLVSFCSFIWSYVSAFLPYFWWQGNLGAFWWGFPWFLNGFKRWRLPCFAAFLTKAIKPLWLRYNPHALSFTLGFR